MSRSTRFILLVAVMAFAGCSGGGFLPFGAGPHSIGAAQLDSIVMTASTSNNISPSLLRAVIHQESGEDPSAISPAGAMGLMQLMPGTAQTYGVLNPWDPAENVAGGAAYLSDLLRYYHGDLRLALAAYNAGSGAVARNGGVPPYAETRNYVVDVLSVYRSAQAAKTARPKKR